MSSSDYIISSISNSISRIIHETDDGYLSTDANASGEDDNYSRYMSAGGSQLSKTILVMLLFFMFVLIGYNSYKLIFGADSDEHNNQNNGQVEVMSIKKEAEIV